MSAKNKTIIPKLPSEEQATVDPKVQAIHSFNVINGINEDRRIRSVADQVLGQAVEASLKVIAEYINKH
jgi:hypothetical protein